MQYKFIPEEMTYDGSQLSSLYAYLNQGVLGDSVLAWVGKCDISADKIVDAEDLLAGHKIYSEKMLHFIVEVFDMPLFSMACLQRLMGDLARDLIYQKTGLFLVRKGDDLYLMQTEPKGVGHPAFEPVKDKDKKLNISIATKSPASALLHFGINISTRNTPVRTCGLEDWDIDPKNFADELAKSFIQEILGLRRATQKVRWVK